LARQAELANGEGNFLEAAGWRVAVKGAVNAAVRVAVNAVVRVAVRGFTGGKGPLLVEIPCEIGGRGHGILWHVPCCGRGMTGGWRPFTDDDIWVCPMGHEEWQPTEADRRMDEVLAAWATAARFRRLALRALRRHRLTFSQWRVLQAADRLVREKDDAVSQLEIARRIESDEGTVSKVVARLMDRGCSTWAQMHGDGRIGSSFRAGAKKR